MSSATVVSDALRVKDKYGKELRCAVLRVNTIIGHWSGPFLLAFMPLMISRPSWLIQMQVRLVIRRLRFRSLLGQATFSHED